MGPPRPVTGIALFFNLYSMFVPHSNHTYWPPLPVTGIALLFNMYMMFVLHREHAYKPPTASYCDGLNFLYVDDVLTSEEAHL
jgi:hypothetical protein